jgi:hypothetical protein
VERGAQVHLRQAAALGLVTAVVERLAGARRTRSPEAFWCACHGGQLTTAELLLERGADINWIGFDGLTPLAAAAPTMPPSGCGSGARAAPECELRSCLEAAVRHVSSRALGALVWR